VTEKQHRHKRRVCCVGGEEFSTVRRDVKFCSNACRQANYRRLQHNGEYPMADDEITLESLVTFELGDIMEGGIALVLGPVDIKGIPVDSRM
jgi:hypothetical protein